MHSLTWQTMEWLQLKCRCRYSVVKKIDFKHWNRLMCMQRPSFGFKITNAYTKPIMISQHRWLSKP
jgi:hypothetical protein